MLPLGVTTVLLCAPVVWDPGLPFGVPVALWEDAALPLRVPGGLKMTAGVACWLEEPGAWPGGVA